MKKEILIRKAVAIGKIAYPQFIVSQYTASKKQLKCGNRYNVAGSTKNGYVLIETLPTNKRPSRQLGIVEMHNLIYAVRHDFKHGVATQLRGELIKPTKKSKTMVFDVETGGVNFTNPIGMKLLL